VKVQRLGREGEQGAVWGRSKGEKEIMKEKESKSAASGGWGKLKNSQRPAVGQGKGDSSIAGSPEEGGGGAAKEEQGQ